eukprot:29891-Pelagococcus_subviridis.AAC.9
MRVVRSEKAGRPDATERENNKTIRGRVEVPLLRASPQRTRVGRQDLRRALYGDASKRVLERPPRVRSLFSSRARVLGSSVPRKVFALFFRVATNRD